MANTKVVPQVPAVPALPVATTEYTQRYQDQFSNVLRLYFNQIQNAFQLLFNTQGGSNLNFPYGSFHQDGTTTLSSSITNGSTTPIPVVSTTGFPTSGYLLIGTELIQYTSTTSTTFAGTITRGALGTTSAAHSSGVAVSEAQGTGSGTAIGVMKFTNTDSSNGVTINSLDSTQIVFSKTGTYNIQFSAQLLSFSNNADNVTIWLRKNGTDVDATAGIVTVPGIHGGVPGAIIAGWNYFVDVVSGDYLSFAWATDSGNSVIATYPAGSSPVHPISPAVILTAQFVSSPTT